MDLTKEFVEIDLHNQKVLREKAKYLPVYILHEDGRESYLARHLKKNEAIPPAEGKMYRVTWPDRERQNHITAEVFNNKVIGSEKYENHFRDFPVAELIERK